MSDILRIYDLAECGSHGVPLDFEKCQTCFGTGRYRDVRIWGTMPGSVVCEVCDGYGSLKAAALAHLTSRCVCGGEDSDGRGDVNGAAEHGIGDATPRCESCQHPMSEGTWEGGDGSMPFRDHDHPQRAVTGHVHYSRCDEKCEHGGSGRMKFWTPAWIKQQDVTQARVAAFSPAVGRSSPEVIEASWRPVDVRCMSWPHDLRPESLKVLCLRCYAELKRC